MVSTVTLLLTLFFCSSLMALNWRLSELLLFLMQKSHRWKFSGYLDIFKNIFGSKGIKKKKKALFFYIRFVFTFCNLASLSHVL